MDPAVALVRLYLHVNGYFTASEYPVFEQDRDGTYSVTTDVDVLAVRLPGAARVAPRKGAPPGKDLVLEQPDEHLLPSDDRVDMIIGEVKEGRAELNRGARDPAVLRTAIRRFGGVPAEECADAVAELMERGVVETPRRGPRIRLMAFGSQEDAYSKGGFTVVLLGHILRVLERTIDERWEVIQHAQFKDPAMGFLAMVEKARRLEGRGREKRERRRR
jgi:hypothetical protein